jgi:hypothetical protein
MIKMMIINYAGGISTLYALHLGGLSKPIPPSSRKEVVMPVGEEVSKSDTKRH